MIAMKKRKIAAAGIALMIIFALCGCSLTLTEPKEIVNDFFDGLKTKNKDTLVLYIENEDINMLLNSKGSEEDLNKIYDSIFRNFSYKVLSTKKNADETKATVTAEVTNVDFSQVLKKYQKKAYNYMQDNLYSGDLSKKKLNAKCLSIFANQVEKASESTETQTREIAISLTKNDNYSWDMELTEEMMEIIMGGLIIPL